MKVLDKEIEAAVWFDKDGVHPSRLRIEEDGSKEVIEVKKVVHKEKLKIAGKQLIRFDCQGDINGQMKTFELRFDFMDMKWILFKI